jgi:hypothetical protein
MVSPAAPAVCSCWQRVVTYGTCLSCLGVQESIVIVEYPKKLASLIRDKLGPLEKLRDRRYGRTYMAIYGPPLVEA